MIKNKYLTPPVKVDIPVTSYDFSELTDSNKPYSMAQIEELLKPCLGYVDLVRIAVKPENVIHALKLAERIKKMRNREPRQGKKNPVHLEKPAISFPARSLPLRPAGPPRRPLLPARRHLLQGELPLRGDPQPGVPPQPLPDLPWDARPLPRHGGPPVLHQG